MTSTPRDEKRMAKVVFREKEQSQQVGVVTDTGSAGFVPGKHLCSQKNAPMVSTRHVSLIDGDVIGGACQSWPESFSHQKRTEEKREAIEERKSFHPSCPFKGRENLPRLT